ncbi:MAG TPA: cupredoxin domain-containing protein [Acidimicrobiia bacterium]|nr:cupredoxin domain-containing protein [Acidimicrobiia bacterium]
MKRLGCVIAIALCVACASGTDTTTTAAAVETTAAPAATTAPGVSTTEAPTGGGEVMVTANDFSFSPATVTVSVGDSVTWTLAEGAHTTSSGTAPDLDGLWDQALTADEPFTFTFEEAGTYEYFCRFHPDFMTGTVTVEP